MEGTGAHHLVLYLTYSRPCLLPQGAVLPMCWGAALPHGRAASLPHLPQRDRVCPRGGGATEEGHGGDAVGIPLATSPLVFIVFTRFLSVFGFACLAVRYIHGPVVCLVWCGVLYVVLCAVLRSFT